MKTSDFLGIIFSTCLVITGPAQEWTGFRGPGGQGITEAAGLPSTFTEKNLRWRVPVGGKGYSSPVYWEGRLYLTREGAGERKREIVCFDANDGKEVWAQEDSFETYKQHNLNSFATSTPVVDAQGLYVVWTTGGKLIAQALDHEGEVLWREELGGYYGNHGSGLSPVLYGDLIVIPNDNEGADCFLIALEKDSGQTRWKIDRKSEARYACYAPPVVYQPEEGDPYLLFTSPDHGLSAVDPESGEVLWQVNPNFKTRYIAVPSLADNLLIIYAGTGNSGKEGAVYELAGSRSEKPELLYKPRRNLPYVPSALGLEGRFYLFSDTGIMSCLDAANGEILWRERSDAAFFSSPVSDGEVIFVADREGFLHSLAPGEEFQVLGSIDLGAEVRATPAIVGDRMYVRTAEHLICLGKPKSSDE